MHGANLRHGPAHGLQRGVVVADLHTAAHEVLLLEDDHATALVRLVREGAREREESWVIWVFCFRKQMRMFDRQDVTHSAADGAQGHETLHVVGEGSAVSIPVRVLSSLQDELLALEVMVLKTNPAKTHTETQLFTSQL